MTSSELLTVPGQWLADWWVPLEAGADETEARADLVVTLGLGFWLVALLVLALSWRWWGTPSRRAWAGARLGAAAHSGLQLARGAAQRWDARQAWGIVWRAQLVHALVYVVAPALWAFARQVLFVITLPFSLMGFGDRTGSSGSWMDHLAQPGCWTFATLCHWPGGQGMLWAKLAWAAIAVAWLVLWRQKQNARR